MTRYIIRKYLGGCPGGRTKAGLILGALGIFFDILLFDGKYFAGAISGSVAVTADSFNNLADAGAHVLALMGFCLASSKPSRRFPFGLGRLEYLSGLLIAGAILLVGGKMLLSSAEAIASPSPVESSPAVFIILLVSIAVKGYMYRYNKIIGGRIGSAALKAVAADSICDCFATGAIVLSILIQRSAGWNIDGWTGLMVAGCILYAGIMSARDSLAPLLGTAVEESVSETIRGIIDAFPSVRSVKDIAVHDYGPDRRLHTMRIVGEISPDSAAEMKRRIRAALGTDAVIEIENDADRNNRGQIRQE